MTPYERLKAIRAIVRNCEDVDGTECWYDLRQKALAMEYALESVVGIVDEYEFDIGVLPGVNYEYTINA